MTMTAVVLFSGGMDSTIALYWARKQYSSVRGIGFLYGQRHALEIERARNIWRLLAAKEGGVRGPIGALKIVTLPSEMFGGRNSLLNWDVPVSKYKTPEEAVAGTGEDTSYIPTRNAIFLSIAASHLLSWSSKGGFIVIGVRGRTVGPVPGFPDCTTTFVHKMGIALTEASFGNSQVGLITIQDPLNHWGKTRAGSIMFAKTLPGCFEALAYTLTCFEGLEPPCGECLPCQRRSQAFKECGLEDPLLVRLNKRVPHELS